MIKTYEKYKSSTIAITEVSNVIKNRAIEGNKIENAYNITNITERLQNGTPPIQSYGHWSLNPHTSHI